MAGTICCMSLAQFIGNGDLYRFPLLKESIKFRLDENPIPETIVIVFFEEEDPIGVLAYDKLSSEEYWIAPLEVLEGYQGLGVGTILLNHLKKTLKFCKSPKIELSCRKEIAGWWEKRGFKVYKKDSKFCWMVWRP